MGNEVSDSRPTRIVIPQLPDWVRDPNRNADGSLQLPDHNNVEYVGRLFEIMKDYFNKCRAHAYLNLSENWNNTVYAFCEPKNLRDTVRFKIIRTVRMPRLTHFATYKHLLYGKFFDMVAEKPKRGEFSYDNDSHRATSAKPALEAMIINEELTDEQNGISPFVTVFEAVKIVMRVSVRYGESSDRPARGRNIFMGLYIPNNNILIVGDWSHSAYGIRFIDKILYDALVDRLDLMPLQRVIIRKRRRPRLMIQLGSDPEFELVSRYSNEVVNASSKIKTTSHPEGGLGRDGAGSQVELRPRAATTPEEAVDILKHLLERFYRMYPAYDLGVAGHSYPLGGHIHIGVGRTYVPPQHLVKMLDDFIGAPTLNLSGKARSGYKTLGAYETKGWGFEYRSAPALIFMTPEITRLAYKIAQNITNRFVNGVKEFTYKYPIGFKELVDTAGLEPEEAQTYLNFINNVLVRVGARNDRMLVEWGVDKPMLTADPNATINTGRVSAQHPLGRVNAMPEDSQPGVECDEDDDYDEEVPDSPSVRALHLTYRDEWDLRVRNSLTSALRERIIPERLLKHVNLVLFGYRRARGFVSNLPVPAPVALREYMTDIHRINDAEAVAEGAPPLGAAPTVVVFRDQSTHEVVTHQNVNSISLNVGMPNIFRQDVSVARNLIPLIVDTLEQLLIHNTAISEPVVTQNEEV